MIKILINSYTCCPGMGSEQGMGWNWITSLVKTGEVELFVITEGEYRSQIEKTLSKGEGINEYGLTSGQIANMHFYWNPIGGDDEARCAEIRKMCWNQGDWRFYKYYREWQKKTADIAREVCSNEKIDVLHQLNMIGFREPGYLWQVSKETGIPLVWGPIGGLKKFPMAYASGLKMKAFNWLKNTITEWQIKNDRRVVETLKQASLLISSIPDSYETIKKYYGLESVIIPETGCFVETNTNRTINTNEHELGCETKTAVLGHSFGDKPYLNLMWVGKFDFRKRLDIALWALATVANPNVVLKVFGTGNEQQVEDAKRLAQRLGIENIVQFMGARPNDEVKAEMRKADAFLFTSVNEDTSTVVLEAVSNQLPVICFDCCGMAAVIDDKVGIKIPLSNPEQSVKDFAAAIERIYKDRELLAKMSENCKARAEELSWENKAQMMVDYYVKIIG